MEEEHHTSLILKGKTMQSNTLVPSDFPVTPIQNINMGLVSHYVAEYLAGNADLSLNKIELAKAALALQALYVYKDYQTAVPEEQYSALDEASLLMAVERLNNGNPVKGAMWGVRRDALPKNAQPGEYVAIRYKDFNQNAVAAGTVTAVYDYPQGKGMIIRLKETNNGFNISSKTGGWRYIALWIPNDLVQTAGFLH